MAPPTGELGGGMGLEGYVKLGYRDELAAIEDPAARRQAYQARMAEQYEDGNALSNASHFGIDDTIDPADSRGWVSIMLYSIRMPDRPAGNEAADDRWVVSARGARVPGPVEADGVSSGCRSCSPARAGELR